MLAMMMMLFELALRCLIDIFLINIFLIKQLILWMKQVQEHMINMKVPKEVTDLEKEIEKVRSEKNSVVVAQKFEDAASFRI